MTTMVTLVQQPRALLVALMIMITILFAGLEAFRRLHYGHQARILALELTEEQSKSVVPTLAANRPTRPVLRPLTAEDWYPLRQTCRGRKGSKWSSSHIGCCLRNFSRPVALTRQDTNRLIDAGFRSSFIDLLPANETVLPRYNTCAVISSSSALLRHQYGADIDRHDAVFRPNVPPIEGYEKYVGSKTTVRVVNSKANMKTAAGAKGTDLAEFLFMRDFPPDPLTADSWSKSPFHPLARFEDFRKKYPHLKYYLLHPLFNWRFGGILPRAVSSSRLNGASTGFFAVGLALTLCSDISVYEVASGQRHVNDTLCHYYDKIPIGCSGFHPFQFERTVLRMLSYNSTDGEGTVYKLKGAHLMNCGDDELHVRSRS